MLKLMTGLLLGWCMLAVPASYADTGAAADTGSAEDTGATEDSDSTEDTGTTTDTGATDTGSTTSTTSSPTYGAADLAGDSGSCSTISAAPAAWMLGCFLIVVARRR
jgi:hypothetical protein